MLHDQRTGITERRWVADGEDAEENHHRPEGEHAGRPQGNCPREQEGHFEVEDDEQDRHQIEAHIELHARIFEGFKPTFVRGIFCGVRAIGAQHIS